MASLLCDRLTQGGIVMESSKKLNRISLVALVIGSMIGGGAFNLPSDMSQGANAGAIIISWIITGIGVVALGLVFQNLVLRKPELDAGIYSYARAGFGKYMGFNSAWGYWLSAWLGNIAYGTLIFSAVGYFIKPFAGGQNVASIIGASVLLWFVHYLVLRGVHSAAFVNLIATIAKLIPVFLFIVVAIFAFHAKTFVTDFWGANQAAFSWASVRSQVTSTMLVTLWVFIGVEGAVVVSERARKRSDIGFATVVGLIVTLFCYMCISLLSLGIMGKGQLTGLANPSMAYVFEDIVGKWGAAFINLGLIISVLSAWIAWTIFAAEIPFAAAKDGVFPEYLKKENKHGAPANSLWLTNGLIQLFLLTLLLTDKAYNFAFSLATSAILIPYLFSALYQVKITILGDGYEKLQKKARVKDMVFGIIAGIYSIWLIYGAGLKYLLLTTILYAAGIFVYYRAQKEKREKRIFTATETICALLIFALAIWAIIDLALGIVTI